MTIDSFGGQLGHLPEGSAVMITALPTLGLKATIDWAERETARRFEVIPYASIRYVEDKGRLNEILHRLKAAGISDIFVPGGDREEPIGGFESAYELLCHLMRGCYFDNPGIAAYPEGHDFLSNS